VTEAQTAAANTDRVELRVPADPAYLAVLRTATAGLAARLDLTLDEIEDLRIAVDEACALVLGPQPLDGSNDPASTHAPEDATPTAASGATLLATFDLDAAGLSVEVSGPARRLPGQESFAWAVLEALVGSLQIGLDPDGRHQIRLRHSGSRRGT
jgi:serine/threonine-protein kinase RsbW